MIARRLENGRVVRIKLNYSKEQQEAFMRLNPTGGFMLVDNLPKSRYECWKWDEDTQGVVLDEDRENQFWSEELKDKLQDMSDAKTQELKTYINGSKATPEQEARYEEKYTMAKAYKADKSYEDKFKLEADFQGITVDELVDAIIAKGDAWKESLLVFNSRIEAFRIKLKKLIASGELKQAEGILNKTNKLDINTTDEEVANLFK